MYARVTSERLLYHPTIDVRESNWWRSTTFLNFKVEARFAVFFTHVYSRACN